MYDIRDENRLLSQKYNYSIMLGSLLASTHMMYELNFN